jgi:pSer/pThr/pTyr-binding forkhead associated (FHA) protein
MAVKRTEPSDDGVVDDKLHIQQTSETANSDLGSFSKFDESADADIDKTTLDLDAFAPYKPTKPEAESGGTMPSKSTFGDVSALNISPSDFSHGFAGLDATPSGGQDDAANWSGIDFGSTPLSTTGEPAVGRPSRLFVQIGKFAANYDLEGDDMLIGRPDSLTDANPDIVIEWDDAISRRHARVYREDGEQFIEDLGSTNGTKVNGITLAPYSPHLLMDGDLIHMGSKTEISYYK